MNITPPIKTYFYSLAPFYKVENHLRHQTQLTAELTLIAPQEIKLIYQLTCNEKEQKPFEQDPNDLTLNKNHFTDSLLRKNELWKNTCFEFFLKNKTHYYELNLNSHGNWNIYEFSDYRQNMKESSEISILKFEFKTINKSEVKNTPCIYQLSVHLKSQFKITSEHEFSITSVLENLNDDKSSPALNNSLQQTHTPSELKNSQFENRKINYFAIKHSKPQPDFHAFESFVRFENL